MGPKITAGWAGKTGVDNTYPTIKGTSVGRKEAWAHTMNINGRALIYALGGSRGTGKSSNVQDPAIIYFDPKDTTNGYDADGNPRGRWFESPTKMKNMYNETKSRGDTAQAVVNNKIYVIGGSTLGDPMDDAVSREIDEYDPVAETWITKTPMPASKTTGTAAAVNGKIYIFCGQDSTYTTYTNTVYAYDPATDSWNSALPSAPTARAYLSPVSAVVNNKIYIMGGMNVDGERSGTVEEFDPAGNGGLGSWKTVNPMPTPRNDLACIAVNGKIYSIGGKRGGPGDNNQRTMDIIEEFDPTANAGMGEWKSSYPASPAYDPSLGGSMSQNRMDCLASVYDEQIYVIGGDVGSYPANPDGFIYADNEAYTPTSISGFGYYRVKMLHWED
ncbi:MAG: hypothetical protein HY920_02810 [Elusimicrobia bacterium]|nr:hypothetical protein [Elusimicrobiota bacterium]